jgi:hypothetical protein
MGQIDRINHTVPTWKFSESADERMLQTETIAAKL